MRIARIVQYFQPKFGYADFYLMDRFRRLGHDVCVITSDLYSPDVNVFSSSAERKTTAGKHYEYGLLVYRLPTLFELDAQPVNFLGFKKVLKDFKPDVVHSNDLFWSITLVSAHYKRNFGYKLFVDSITGTFNPAGYKRLAASAFKLVFKGYLRKNVDKFFAISEGSMRWLSKNFSVPREFIEVIPLGADTALFKSDYKLRQITRENLGFATDEIVLIYSGKIVPSKDIGILIKALALVVSASLKKVKLLIIGNGPKKYLIYLKNLIETNNIKENIIFIPTVDRKLLPNYYNAADIAVWPGDPSISIIEAMATGLPIILCSYQFPREDAYDTSHLLKQGNGLSFPRGNPISLARCIKELVENEKLRKEMGKNSRKLVENELNWDIIATKYLEIYSK